MSQTPEKEQRKRRPWLRYFGLGCLLLILLLAGLFRPIVFGIAQLAGQQFARSEHLALQFKLRGSVFTNLYIEDLTLRPLPENKTFPVTNLTLGQLGLRYHPLKLVQQDWEHVIELVAVHDLDLTLRPTSAEASVGKPTPGPESSSGLPKLIPLIPEKIDFRNVNVHLADPTGGFDLQNLNLLLDAKQPGYLRIGRIRVPNAVDWQGIDAGLNRKGEHILLTHLQLPPYLNLASADVDLTRATTGRFGLTLLGETYGAGLQGNLGFQQTGSSNTVDVHLILDRLNLAKIQPQLPLKGIIENVKLDLSGDIAQPDSFSGQVAVTGNGLQYQDKVIGIVDLQTSLQQGRGTIDRGLIGTSPNRLALAGTYQLPTSLNDPLTGLAADIGIAGWLTRPDNFVPDLRGSALLRASVHLANGLASLHLETKAGGISSQGATLEDGQIHLFGSVVVPLGPDLIQDVAVGALVSARTLQWDKWHLDRFGLTAGLAQNGQLRILTDLSSGGANLRANVGFQQTGSSNTADVHLILDRLDLAKFQSQLPLKGIIHNFKLDLSGDIAQPDSFSGQLAVTGSGLQYQDKVIGVLNLQTSLQQGRGTIDRGWIGTLPNRLALAGTYQLPTSLNDPLTSLAANIGIAGWLTRPDNFAPDVRGSALLRASVHLANGLASLHLDTRADGISSQGATLDDAKIHLLGSVAVPLGPDLGQDVAVGAVVSARALRWDTWHLDRFGLTAGLAENGQLRIHTDLSSGETSLRADAQAIVPNPGQELNVKTVEAHLKYHIGPLSDFTDQTLVSGQVTGDGDVDLVDTHSHGRLSLQAKDLGTNGVTVPSVNLDAEFHDQDARLKQLRVDLDPHNYLNVTGSLGIEQSLPFQLQGLVALGDLQGLNHFLAAQKLPADLAGQLSLKLQANGDAKLENLRATISAGGSKIGYQGFVVRDLKIDANVANQLVQLQHCLLQLDDRNQMDVVAQVDLRPPYPFTSNGHVALTDLGFFRSFLEANKQPADLSGQLLADFAAHGDSTVPLQEGSLSAHGSHIGYRGFKLSSLEAQAVASSPELTLKSLDVILDPQNRITAFGKYSLTAPNPYHVESVVDLRDLRSFDALIKSTGQELNLSGQLNVRLTADGSSDLKLPEVTFAVGGARISAANLVIQTVDASGTLRSDEFDLPSLRLILDSQNLVDMRAHAKLADPYPFSADGRLNFQNLAIFNPLLRAFGQDLGLAGRINATGSGQGDLRRPQGSFELHGDQLAAKGVQNVKLDVVGSVQNSQVDLRQIEVRSPIANLSATLTATPDFVEIPSLRLEQKGNVINGNLKVPLNLQPGAKLPIALDQPLTLNLNAPRISLASFQPDKPQVTGNVAVNVTAGGTVGKPDATVRIDLTDFRSVAAASIGAASSHLEISLKENVLALNGNVSQPDIRPLQMRGQVPLSVERLLATGKVDPQTPVQFSVNLPDTDLGFIRRLSPIVRVIQGRAAMDATLGGTIANPVVGGQFRANISQLKAASDVIPPLTNFLTQIDFRQNRIELTQVRGLVAGGPLSAGGNIDLAKLTDPQFNLNARGQEILLTRSDNVIVRANFDLAVRGPLSAAEVGGTVGITHSRFFQDIDILPLNLPGRPPPQPPTIPPQTSIQTPPLNNWKFNIAIRTADPFLIQSNLARGRVVINLHVGGTGAKPEVTGYVKIENLVASLPFSHMTIDNSFINFVPGGNPLDPNLNILGRSPVRDYEIRMLIFGRVSNFQILFQSTPPLPQGDIATLLATGSTPQEFVDNPSLIAGRAAFVVITNLLGKVFRTNPTEQQRSYLERLQVDIIPGSTVGSQDIRARFSLTDNWQIIGEFGSEGNVGGRLRYLVRFR